MIVTGTPGGVGDRRDPPVYMKDGDVIEIEISHLGVLKKYSPQRKLDYIIVKKILF